MVENRISEVMADQGRHKKWLQEHMGVSRTTLYNWLSNNYQPNINQLKQIAQWLNVTVNDLIV